MFLNVITRASVRYYLAISVCRQRARAAVVEAGRGSGAASSCGGECAQVLQRNGVRAARVTAAAAAACCGCRSVRQCRNLCARVRRSDARQRYDRL